MNTLKKWNLIRKITGIIVLLFLLIILYLFISNYFSDAKYPYPMMGLDVYNWFDAFIVETSLLFYILGIPLLIDIVLFIVSIIKTRDKTK